LNFHTIIKTALIAAVGGFLFNLIHMPVPWMLGPLAALLIYKGIFRKSTAWPLTIREASQIILGFVMGRSFSPEAGREIIHSFPAMFVTTVLIIAFTMLCGHIMSRHSSFSYSSCILGNIPGGMTQTALLCDEIEDADVSAVTILQTIRLLTVIFLVPFLVLHSTSALSALSQNNQGIPAAPVFEHYPLLVLYILLSALAGLGARKIRIPTPYLLGPMLVVAVPSLIGVQAPHMPSVVVSAAQACFGAYLGNTIDIGKMEEYKKLLPFAFGITFAVIALSMLAGYILTLITHMDLLTAFLATAPGGMSEMAVTAISVKADLPTVTSYQLFRVLFINLLTIPFVSFMLQRKMKQTLHSQ
jgi:membrane AbrB-like protein